MIIVAGWLRVAPDERDDYLVGCRAVVEQARGAPGCLDFSLGADLAEADRINVYERWTGESELLAFRGSGPDGDQQIAIVAADVRRYIIESEAPA